MTFARLAFRALRRAPLLATVVLGTAWGTFTPAPEPTEAAPIQDSNMGSIVTFTSASKAIAGFDTIRTTYTCPNDHPYSVNWQDVSPSGVVTTEDLTVEVGDHGKTITITATNSNRDKSSLQIEAQCSSYWPPTTSDCGNEGQRVCWGAVKFSGWRRADWMFRYSERGACDRGLRPGAGQETSTCVNDGQAHSTRHELTSQADSWEVWALDQQSYQLAADEPINWVARPKTHESYNDQRDAYAIPSQVHSLSDQLDAGVRGLELRPRWGLGAHPYLRLSHGDNNCAGCSGLDRPYTYAVEEIASWLDKHPDQIIHLIIGQYDGGAGNEAYLLDPLRKFLGKRVLGAGDWCRFLYGSGRFARTTADMSAFQQQNVTTSCANAPAGVSTSDTLLNPYRWPTLAEMKALGKQVLVEFDANNNVDSDVTIASVPWRNAPNPNPNNVDPNSAFNFNAAQCLRDGTASLPGGQGPKDEYPVSRLDYYRMWTGVAETRVFGEAVGATADWPGYIYGLRSEVSSVDDGNNTLGAPRPFASRGTSLEGLMDCNVRNSLDMFMADNNFNGVDHTVDGLTDRRRAMIWTWVMNDYGQPNTAASLSPTDHHFHSETMTKPLPAACAEDASGQFRTGDPYLWTDPAGAHWHMTARSYTFGDAAAGCQQEFPGYVFGVPVNKYQLNRLLDLKPAGAVWLAYTNHTAGCDTDPKACRWTITTPPAITEGPQGLTTPTGIVNETSGPYIVAPSASVRLTGYAATRDDLPPDFKWTVDMDGARQVLDARPESNDPVVTALRTPGLSALSVQAIDANGLTSKAFHTWILTTLNTKTAIVASAFGTNSDPKNGTQATMPLGHGDVTVYASGSGELSMAALSGDPTGKAPKSTAGTATFGVGFAQSRYSSAVIKECSQLPGTAYWYDATAGAWRLVSDQRSNGSGCRLLTISPKTSPTLAQLTANNVLFTVAP